MTITDRSNDVVLYTSKASQNETKRISIPRHDNGRAVAAIERWIVAVGIELMLSGGGKYDADARRFVLVKTVV